MSDAILVTKPTAPEWWLKQHAKNANAVYPEAPICKKNLPRERGAA